jgi:hypothetical protein
MDLPPEFPVQRDESIVPVPIVLIALYELAKAAYLLFVFYAVWRQRGGGQAGVASFGPLAFALPIFALIMIIAGLGLLALQRWARHMFLLGGLLALPWFPVLPSLTGSGFGPIVDYQLLRPYLPRTVMMAIMVIDVLVYAALLFYPDVAESFGEKGGDPYFTND